MPEYIGKLLETVYEYEGLYYSETDLSYELGDLYGGSLNSLYWAKNRNNEAYEATFYYVNDDPEVVYDSAEELIEKECQDIEVDPDELVSLINEIHA